jgi:AbrB family looped-hinge helix DNA binding protein
MVTFMVAQKTLRGSSRVTAKGQITIPLEIRDEFNIKPGDTVYFITEGETPKLVLQKGPIKLT